MTILVLMGGLPSDYEKVVAEMMAARPGRIEKLSLAGIQDPTKLDDIQTHLYKNRSKNDDRVTIVTGISEARSVKFWREHGGIFCHVRGPLDPVFHSERLEFSDYHVAPVDYDKPMPDIVLDPTELLSEIEIKRRNAVEG